ncbi:unnamed protein product [Lupinus luteus]|uniref:Uncharacterized protein n=1 Tax=Lupinus luteus TaxID=3873 RepID=A0AAV1YA51_LUPLU
MKGQTIPSMPPPIEPIGPSENELLKTQLKIADAKLEEARDKIEQTQLTIEKKDKIILALKRKKLALREAEMCYQSEKFRLNRTVKRKDAHIVDLKNQLKAQSHVAHKAQTKEGALEQELEGIKESEKQA